MTNPESFQSTAGTTDLLDVAVSSDGRSRRSVARDDDGLVVTITPREEAILVGIELSGNPGLLSLEDSLAELALLAQTADLAVIGTISQRLDSPNPATFIGTGKLEELHTLVLETGATVAIFDDELSPRQQREIEKVLGQEIKVIDRTALILDIFWKHEEPE